MIVCDGHRRGRTLRRLQLYFLFDEGCLAGVEGGVVGPAEEYGEPVACGVLGEILVGDGGVLLQPLLGRELFEGGSELAVDLTPRLLESGGSDRIGQRAIGIGNVNLVQFPVEAVAEAEEGKETVVYGSEMADQVEQPVLPRGDLALELLIGERGYYCVQTADDELP